MSATTGEEVGLVTPENAAAAPQDSAVGRVRGRDAAARELESYFESAAAWDRDIYRSLEASRARAWVVAVVSTGLLALSLVALVLLLPLKETVPFVITKERETGFVEVARMAGAGLTADEALSEFNVVRFVTARETYDPDDLQTSYDLVHAMASAEVFDAYDPLYRRGVPGNLIDRYGRAARVRVAIKTVSFLGSNRAFVRFSTDRSRGEGAQVEHWAATVTFRYTQPAPDLRDRAKNPLGFEVVGYRRDQEVVGASDE